MSIYTRSGHRMLLLDHALQGRGGSLEKSLLSRELSSASRQPHSSLET